MSVYARFKKVPEGLRALVELLESTPLSKRQKMIEVGMEEDQAYTEKALSYVMSFKDIINLPDVELAEVIAKAPARSLAFAIHNANEEIKKRFFRNSQPAVVAEIRDVLNMNIGPREIGGAQLKVVSIARELERKGLVRIKRIPMD
jgi:flagellar motor switch protein FliG